MTRLFFALLFSEKKKNKLLDLRGEHLILDFVGASIAFCTRWTRATQTIFSTSLRTTLLATAELPTFAATLAKLESAVASHGATHRFQRLLAHGALTEWWELVVA